MTDEELRESARNNYAAQMEMLGYQTNGNPKDMVEVVRCKDCVFIRKLQGRFICINTGHCQSRTVRPDWFCVDGERQ